MDHGLTIRIPLFFDEIKFYHNIKETNIFPKTIQLIFNIVINSYNTKKKHPEQLICDEMKFNNNLLKIIKRDIDKLEMKKKPNDYIDERVYNYSKITLNVLSCLALNTPYYRNIYKNNAKIISHLQNEFKIQIHQLLKL
jgi:hypothetical protein